MDFLRELLFFFFDLEHLLLSNLQDFREINEMNFKFVGS